MLACQPRTPSSDARVSVRKLEQRVLAGLDHLAQQRAAPEGRGDESDPGEGRELLRYVAEFGGLDADV